jgi:hypothetical protein
VLLDIMIGGIPAATILACQERQDVQSAGISQSRCGFAWPAPGDLDPTRVTIRRANGMATLRWLREK